MTLETATTEELLAELRRRLEHVPTPPKGRCEREFLRICEEHELDPQAIRSTHRSVYPHEKNEITKKLSWAGFAPTEIARAMNRTPGAIKLRLHPKKRKPNARNSRDDAPGWVQPRR
jgi:DNA-directed RNA polymerase specialized sigma24 family protein